MSTVTVSIAFITVLYLMIGRAAYRKIVLPTMYRDALEGDIQAIVSLMHEQDKGAVFYLTYAAWLITYPVLIALGWAIARWVPE